MIAIAIITSQHSVGQLSADTSAVREVHVKSVWKSDYSVGIAPLESQDFYLMWDVSVPMGGYIHDSNTSLSVALSKIQELVKNGLLNSDYGRSKLKCMGITDSIAPFAQCDDNQLRDRDFFMGVVSEVGLGVEFMIDSLRSGKMMGAALITDLMATTEYGTGATALLRYFEDQELMAHFTDGEIYMGIVGVASDYWGIKKGSCETVSGPMGCWFHEGIQQWVPLDDVVKRPIYIIVMGRRLEGEDRFFNSVNTIIGELHGSLQSLGYDVKLQRVTQGALGPQTNLIWHNPSTGERGRPPINLNMEKGFSCNNRDVHTLSSEFEDHGIMIDEIWTEIIDSLQTFSQVRKDGEHGIKLSLDCKTVLDLVRKERRCKEGDSDPEKRCNCTIDSTFQPNLSQIITKFRYDDEDKMNWNEWSSIQHSDSLTLYLADFIDGLSPDYYDAMISPVPPLDCSRSRR